VEAGGSGVFASCAQAFAPTAIANPAASAKRIARNPNSGAPRIISSFKKHPFQAPLRPSPAPSGAWRSIAAALIKSQETISESKFPDVSNLCTNSNNNGLPLRCQAVFSIRRLPPENFARAGAGRAAGQRPLKRPPPDSATLYRILHRGQRGLGSAIRAR
jgi:hypothetical protein